jgi:chloramphenicol O-acetyltransferase type A
MRTIDLETWPRREHFMLYGAMDYPHFSMCANVDLTSFHDAVMQAGVSFTVATAYVLARVANDIPEFRYRIRDGEVVEHETVHPATTILTGEDLFSFCWFDYTEDFSAFLDNAAAQVARVKEHGGLETRPGRDDVLYMTSIPWVSFTSFMHPLPLNPADSIPRFAWGRFFRDGESLQMPLNVQAHHAVVDGLHMGRYYAGVQDYLWDPSFVSGVT